MFLVSYSTSREFMVVEVRVGTLDADRLARTANKRKFCANINLKPTLTPTPTLTL